MARAELCLFGSALRDDCRPDSDIDLLVTFVADAGWRARDLLRMQDELEALLGRKVDLVERAAVEENENWIRRRHILQHMVRLRQPASRLVFPMISVRPA